jgi:hypothetical protein
MSSLMIQSDGPFKAWCNTCNRWVPSERINIDGTHDADESRPARTGRGIPPPERTTHTVWDDAKRDARPEGDAPL